VSVHEAEQERQCWHSEKEGVIYLPFLFFRAYVGSVFVSYFLCVLPGQVVARRMKKQSLVMLVWRKCSPWVFLAVLNTFIFSILG
jgi:hypothetical protein